MNYLGSSSLVVGPASIITTVAGNGTGGSGPLGDNGPATAAGLDNPEAVAVDASGDLFIADCSDNRIREVNALTHVITTVAGGGTNSSPTYSGPATAAVLNNPTGIAVDSGGDLFIADYGNNVIREVNASTHVISTVVGTGTLGYSGDNGPATAAKLGEPQGIALDSSGDIFIADTYNNRIREVNGSTRLSPPWPAAAQIPSQRTAVRPPPQCSTIPRESPWTPAATCSSPMRGTA